MKLTREAIRQGVSKLHHFASKNAPTALVALGTGGFVATVIFACKETPKAIEAIEQAKIDKGEDLTVIETVTIGAKHYWKPAAIGIASLGCFIGAHSVNLRRQAALSAAYSLSEKALKEYKDKVVEEFGEHKADTISTKIAEDKVSAYSFPENVVHGEGPLWILAWTNKSFRVPLEDIRRLVNDLNEDLYSCKGKAYFSGEIKLNDFLYELSVIAHDPTIGSVALGEQFGWRADLTGCIDLDIRYTKNAYGEPCGVINIKPLPLTENVHDIYY